MSDVFRQRIPNSLAELGAACSAVTTFLDEKGAPGDCGFLANLVVEELISNTIKYGYSDEAPHWIELDLEWNGTTLSLEIRDDGHAFDPLVQEEPDLSLPADERPIGGLGLHLVKAMTDEVTYQRADGKNIVRITKQFEAT